MIQPSLEDVQREELAGRLGLSVVSIDREGRDNLGQMHPTILGSRESGWRRIEPKVPKGWDAEDGWAGEEIAMWF